jgi:hypothetical protein
MEPGSLALSFPVEHSEFRGIHVTWSLLILVVRYAGSLDAKCRRCFVSSKRSGV